MAEVRRRTELIPANEDGRVRQLPSLIFYKNQNYMKKKYGIKGISECVLRLPVGNTVVVCNFTNGDLQSREPIPASYTTSNPIVQHVIESCDKFKNGKIYIMAEYGDDPAPAETPAAAPKAKAKASKKIEREPRVMENVKTYGDAMTVLMTENGVNLGELKSVEDCIAKAAELGISFPNLKA